MTFLHFSDDLHPVLTGIRPSIAKILLRNFRNLLLHTFASLCYNSSMKQNNPFIIVGYNGPEYFCDRVKETKKMIGAIENDRNITLIAPRRYGKTGLIHHVFGMLPKEYSTIYLDIFALKDLTAFTKSFASAVVGMLDTPIEKTLSSIATFFKSCRPTITPQSDGTPKFSFDIAPHQAEETLSEAFYYLRKRDRRVVVAIDEFQQILEFPETGTEALLRSHVQGIPWARFVFAGSRHHLMGEMFTSAKHPFYQSTDILSLDVIDCAKYCDFARNHFESSGQPFSEDCFNALYSRFDGVTWYVQSILNRIWQTGAGFTDPSRIDAVVDEMVEDRALILRDLYFSLSGAARKVLAAIAAEGEARELFSNSFIRRHDLPATSTIRSTIKTLTANDLVYRTETGYVVYDRIFAEWLRKANP